MDKAPRAWPTSLQAPVLMTHSVPDIPESHSPASTLLMGQEPCDLEFWAEKDILCILEELSFSVTAALKTT